MTGITSLMPTTIQTDPNMEIREDVASDVESDDDVLDGEPSPPLGRADEELLRNLVGDTTSVNGVVWRVIHEMTDSDCERAEEVRGRQG